MRLENREIKKMLRVLIFAFIVAFIHAYQTGKLILNALSLNFFELIWKLVAILKVGGFAKTLINTSRSNKLQQTNNDEVSYCGGCNSGTIPSCNRCGVVCHCNCGPSCYCRKSCRCTRARRCAMHQ